MTGQRFDDYELDPSVPELRRRGRRVHLQIVPLRALEMLLERPNELVPREAFFEEAEREMRYAQQLDPLSLIANAALGWVRYHAGRHDEALKQYRLTLELDPGFELAYMWSGWALEALGRLDEAHEMLLEAVSRSGGSGISSASLARVKALRGERDRAERILRELEQTGGYVPAYEIAKASFALQDAARANEWLRRAYEERSHSLVFLRVDRQLAGAPVDADLVRLISPAPATRAARAQ